MKSHGELHLDLELDDVRRYFDLYMTNIRAVEAYNPSPYPGRVTVFRALESSSHPDPSYGWGELALGGVEVHDIPGSHTTLLSPPHVPVLAKALRGCLERLEGV
jgi:thioesterase domain-containing protein